MGTRLYKTASTTSAAAASATSNATFLFQSVPMGLVWTGTIQILNAPISASHICTIGGIVWAEWTGYQPSPVIQALLGESIQVQSTSLLANTNYQAALIGTVDEDTAYIPVWPLASYPIPPSSALFFHIGSGTGITNLGSVDVSSFNAVSVLFSDGGSGAVSAWILDIQWDNATDTTIIADEEFIIGQNGNLNVILPIMGQRLKIFTQGVGTVNQYILSVQGLVGYGGDVHYATATAEQGIIEQTALVVAGNTTPIGTAGQLYAGPCVLAAIAGGVPCTYDINFLDGATGTYLTKYTIDTETLFNGLQAAGAGYTGPSHFSIPFIAPTRQMQIAVNNRSGSNHNFIANVYADHR